MGNLSMGLNKFMVRAIKILLPLVIISAIGRVFSDNLIPKIGFVIIALIYGGVITFLYKYYKSINWSKKNMLITILVIAFIVRGLWLLNYNTVVFSDFATMFESAKNVLNGDYSVFAGTSYIARFPHLTIMVLYFALMIKLFGESLIALKFVNLLLGVVSVYLIYKICNIVFKNDKLAVLGGGIAAIFPPMVTYVGIMCTENIAIPFYLSAIYFFLKAVGTENSSKYYFISGILLSLGNLFRMVAVVTVIAMFIYIIVFVKNGYMYKVKSACSLISAFIIILVGTSFTLQTLKITEYPLWSGAEPSSTNILKGTNMMSMGMWNEEDAKVPELCNYEYEKMDEMAKEKIKERLTETPIYFTIPFYIAKFSTQWYDGDCGGTFWTEQGLGEQDTLLHISRDGRVIFQLFFVILLILAWKGLNNKKIFTGELVNMNLFYLMLCGYGASYLITENQSRYAYIVSWMFIIFALVGVEEIRKWKNS